MSGQDWRIGRAALYGAVVGVLVTAAQIFVGPGAASPVEPAHTIGTLAGGSFGWALLFAIAAWLRNAIMNRR